MATAVSLAIEKWNFDVISLKIICVNVNECVGICCATQIQTNAHKRCLCSSLSYWMWMIAFRVYIEWFVVMLVIRCSADSMHVNCLLSEKERGTHYTLSPHDHSICMRLASSSSSSKKKCHKHKAVHQHFMTSPNWKLFATDTKTGKNVCGCRFVSCCVGEMKITKKLFYLKWKTDECDTDNEKAWEKTKDESRAIQ